MTTLARKDFPTNVSYAAAVQGEQKGRKREKEGRAGGDHPCPFFACD